MLPANSLSNIFFYLIFIYKTCVQRIPVIKFQPLQFFIKSLRFF